MPSSKPPGATASTSERRSMRHPAPPGGDLFANAANLSLFASKRLLDIRIPSKGLDRTGSDAVRGYLAAPVPDTLLVCRAVGLEWRQRSSSWYKAIESAGAVVTIPPLAARDLPRWLNNRCRAAGLTLDGDALDALVERVEGNLLAARQEIEKLKLSKPTGTISADDIAQAVGRLRPLRYLRTDRRRVRRPPRASAQDALHAPPGRCRRVPDRGRPGQPAAARPGDRCRRQAAPGRQPPPPRSCPRCGAWGRGASTSC